VLAKEKEKSKATKMSARQTFRFQWAAAAILLIVFVVHTVSSSSVQSRLMSGEGCPASERRALISVKDSFVDPSGRLLSWQGENCCQWEAIQCDVIKLDLSADYREEMVLHAGEMSSSIAARLTLSEVPGSQLQ
jgi:hypothetical protein